MVFPPPTPPSLNSIGITKDCKRDSMSSNLCKCLFGTPTQSQSVDMANLTQKAMVKEQRRFKRRWNFDTEDSAPETKVPVPVPSSQPGVYDLAVVAKTFVWEKISNDNLPYFYYKPVEQGVHNTELKFRPLNCQEKDVKVPCTPHKRRYRETDEFEERMKTREASGCSPTKRYNSIDQVFELCVSSQAARRLDFSSTNNSPSKPPLLMEDFHGKNTPTKRSTAVAAATTPTGSPRRTLNFVVTPKKSSNSPNKKSTNSSNKKSINSSNKKFINSPNKKSINSPNKKSTNSPNKKLQQTPKKQHLITGKMCSCY